MKALYTLLLSVFLCLGGPAVAQDLLPNTILPAGRYVWNDVPPQSTLSVKVNLRTQMMYLYAGDEIIASSAVSTGRDGYLTTQGLFTVLGKEVNHFSKKYKADMPFTMWFNNQGEALHAGGDPGVRSSHGCVHLPKAFAAKLYQVLQVGDSVEIVDEAPVLNLTF